MDIFGCQIIIVPVDLTNHWCIAIINISDQTIKYFDSFASPNNAALTTLADYLKAESLDKKKVEFDMSGWKLENVGNIPHQNSEYDCGVFSCMFAEFASRNEFCVKRCAIFPQENGIRNHPRPDAKLNLN